ncbi:MAG: M4 family metallopeptidase, partial [Phaeodactylibacter sp.]|nr:M4 family metallopeptidase [Phaeodactylibacter sp.]
MNRIFILALLVIWFMGGVPALAQKKAPLQNQSTSTIKPDPTALAPMKPIQADVPAGDQQPWQPLPTTFQSLPKLTPSVDQNSPVRVSRDPQTGRVLQIEGHFLADLQAPFEVLATRYLDAVAEILGIPSGEVFQVKNEHSDDQGYSHLRLQQIWAGLPIYGGELVLHFKGGEPYLLNGRTFDFPATSEAEPALSASAAKTLVRDHILAADANAFQGAMPEQLFAGPTETQELLWYPLPDDPATVRLAWHVTMHPDLVQRLEYFVDAQTGEVLHFYNNACQFHHPHTTACSHTATEKTEAFLPPGPEVGNGTDLLGVNRSLNTWKQGSTYYLIDAARNEMFNNGQSTFPDDPVGVIWTLDGFHEDYSDPNFGVGHVTSSNNSWGNPESVSAHYNGGKAYEYFLSTFGRVSINGEGGNILSVVNVEDENGPMDNAFWNGFAMFYGNGNFGFKPLARGLDVAGHEMSHGVVQATANLEYYGESGALNESFADVFGAMIDRDDWKIGEDVVQTSAFPSGALRDMQNPNQGGSGLNDPGWQPAHTNEQYSGNQDNGGVHINSGIPNRAFYLFADAVGKAKAEQVYYLALSDYLVKSSKFVDCRIAVISAATQLYGSNSSEVSAAAAAFDAVGILGGSGGNYQDDIGTNPGDPYLLATTPNFQDLFLYDGNGDLLADPLTDFNPISRPSVTDDGSAIVYVSSDQRIRAIFIDWSTGYYTEEVLHPDAIWRNIAVSRDGRRVAALTADVDNLLWVYDYGLEEWQTFELYNPTYTQGVATGDALYADVLEWDFYGSAIMYDAFNRIEGGFGQVDLEYWDIGFMHVWNAASNNWSNGTVSKLFSGLPENVSIGNPTFSKNSDYVIAFDYIDSYWNEYYIYGVNIQTGDYDVIYWNLDTGVPNYDVDDNGITFDA